jgi:hypothetical protein
MRSRDGEEREREIGERFQKSESLSTGKKKT